MALLKIFILFLICTSFHLKVGATSISPENDICDNKEHPKILQKAFAEYSKDINILCAQYESATTSLKKSRLEYKKFIESVSNKGLDSVFYLPKNKAESFLWAEKHVAKNFRGAEICWAAGMAQVLRTLETNQISAEWCFLNTYSSSDNSLCFKEIEDQLISEKTITLNFIASAEVLVKDKFKNRKFVKYCSKDYKYDHDTDTLLPLEPEYSSLLSDFNRLNWSNPYVVLSRSAEYRGYYNDFKTFIIPNLFSADTSVEQNRMLNSIEYSKKIINDSIPKITQLSATLREAAESYNLGYSSHEDYLFAKKMGLRNPDELSIHRLSANLKIPKADLINLFSLGINSYEKILSSAEEAKIIGYTSNIDFQKVLQFELDKKYSIQNNISLL